MFFKSMVHLSLKVDSTPSTICAVRIVFNGLFLKQEKIHKVGERRGGIYLRGVRENVKASITKSIFMKFSNLMILNEIF